MSKTSAELRAELAAMEAELPALHVAVAAGQAADRRLRQIGSGGRYGLLGGIQAQIERAVKAEKQAEEDSTARRAIIVQPIGYLPEEWVVQGVTPDWVTVRRVGYDSTRKYSTHNGACMSRWERSTLDIPATFPEGIEAYRKAAKVKK